jgi:hypothetical protein
MKFLSTIPDCSFGLSFSWSISRSEDYYGQNRLKLTTWDNKKYVTVGGGYSLEDTVLVEWLNDICQAEDAQQRLAEIYQSRDSELGYDLVRPSSDGYYIKEGKGTIYIHNLMNALGMKFEEEFSSKRKNNYKTGYYIENVGY